MATRLVHRHPMCRRLSGSLMFHIESAVILLSPASLATYSGIPNTAGSSLCPVMLPFWEVVSAGRANSLTRGLDGARPGGWGNCAIYGSDRNVNTRHLMVRSDMAIGVRRRRSSGYGTFS